MHNQWRSAQWASGETQEHKSPYAWSDTLLTWVVYLGTAVVVCFLLWLLTLAPL